MACDTVSRSCVNTASHNPHLSPAPFSADTISSRAHEIADPSSTLALRLLAPDSSILEDHRKHQNQNHSQRPTIGPPVGSAVMSHHYHHHDEDQEYTYGRNNQYNFSQPSFNQSYSKHQVLAPYNHHSTETASIAPSYSSQQAIYTQAPQHSSLITHSSSTGYQCHPQYMSQPRFPAPHRLFPMHEPFWEVEIEAQESCNEQTVLSEPVIPALEGFPDVREFDQLMKSYVDDLSVKKQDKALIHSRRARNIKIVLTDPKDTAIESAQFRFWVKKMFTLVPKDNNVPMSRKMICHEGKPVAIREKLFKILTRAHQQCQHGGRDKTSAQVRRIYSWVPKELISRFVKICPTCQVRRGGSRLTPPTSCRSSPKPDHALGPSPYLLSPPDSRRESIISRPGIPYPARAEAPHANQSNIPSALTWPPSPHHTSLSSQYHNSHMHPLPSTASSWASLPRTLTSGSETNGTGGGTHGLSTTMSMPSSHLDYQPTYDEAQHLPEPHPY
ncbi:hypothetical protein H106_04544 [Trichophyton rubrum CBS 735.88]|nr:hypothetical protein H106_04544 [Trichophyton rubrum CBS 735.88]